MTKRGRHPGHRRAFRPEVEQYAMMLASYYVAAGRLPPELERLLLTISQ